MVRFIWPYRLEHELLNFKCVCYFAKGGMNMLQRFWLGPLLFEAFVLAMPTAEAQVLQPPPNNGFNATIALPSTTDAFWTSVKEGLEKAGDGLDAQTGDMGIKAGKGMVTGVDRSTKQITIKYANGKTETLHSGNSFTAHSSRVIVHYADESGRQVARFVKPAHCAYP